MVKIKIDKHFTLNTLRWGGMRVEEEELELGVGGGRGGIWEELTVWFPCTVRCMHLGANKGVPL
jgi:hypothetical protein